MTLDLFFQGGADISPCGRYRWRLWRQWGPINGNRVCWVMLNPSTADGELDDPTIRRCIGFSKAWGYDALDVVNLFAFRSTNPRGLDTAIVAGVDIIGAANDGYIAIAAARASRTIAAWGRGGDIMDRGEAVKLLLKRITEIHAVRLLADRTPEHPLYLPKNLQPVLLAFGGA